MTGVDTVLDGLIRVHTVCVSLLHGVSACRGADPGPSGSALGAFTCAIRLKSRHVLIAVVYSCMGAFALIGASRLAWHDWSMGAAWVGGVECSGDTVALRATRHAHVLRSQAVPLRGDHKATDHKHLLPSLQRW